MRTVEIVRKATPQIRPVLREGSDIRRVAAGVTFPRYNNEPPYHPSAIYPELWFTDVSSFGNHPYRLLRDLLFQLGLDRRNFESPLWNPLRGIIQPGMTVVVKPDLAVGSEATDGNLFAAVTHPSIVRAMIDYVYLALDGTGRIIVACDPPRNSSRHELVNALRLDAIQAFYLNKFRFDIELGDPTRSASGDQSGHIAVGLGSRSRFHGLPLADNLEVEVDKTEDIGFAGRVEHQYRIPNIVLTSDVLISIPKMKIDAVAGVALNLEGLTAIGSRTDRMPPDTDRPEGDPAFDRLITKAEKWLLARLGARQIHREDISWRTIADLATITAFADADGKMHDTAQRQFFCVVDGVIGGENNGPLTPDARPCGCLVVGENPLAVDMVTTRLMGFDVRKLRQFDLVMNDNQEFPSSDKIEIINDEEKIQGAQFFDAGDRTPMFKFRPHPSWVGRIEV